MYLIVVRRELFPLPQISSRSSASTLQATSISRIRWAGFLEKIDFSCLPFNLYFTGSGILQTK
jgi:hypothetical protein